MTVIQKLDAIADTLAAELPLLRSAISEDDNYGAAFPQGYPAFKPWFHSGNGEWWYYNNQHWVTANKRWIFGRTNTSVSVSNVIGATNDGQNVFVTDVFLQFLITGTHTSSHYWNITLNTYNSGGNLAAPVHQASTVGYSAGSYNRLPNGPNTNALPAYSAMFGFFLTPIGAPGTIELIYGIGYRVRG